MAKGGGNNNQQQGKTSPGITLSLPVGLDDLDDGDTMARATTVAAGLALLIPVAYFGYKGIAKLVYNVKPDTQLKARAIGNDPQALQQGVGELARTNPKACRGIAAELSRTLSAEDKQALIGILNNGS